MKGEALRVARAFWRGPDMADEHTAAPDGDKEARELWARAPISDRETVVLGIGLLAQVVIYVLFLWWVASATGPAAPTPGQPAAPTKLDWYGVLMVLLAGAIGGLLHAIMSFAVHIARRDFSRSWLWWYVTRPFQGAIVGFAVLFVTRMIEGGAKLSSPDTIIGIGVLAGIFSEQAIEKLSQIASTMLAPGRQKELPATLKKPMIKVVKGSGDNEFDAATTSLTIVGDNFAEKAKVFVDGAPQPTEWKSALQIDVPLAADVAANLATATEIAVVVENPDQQKSGTVKLKRKG